MFDKMEIFDYENDVRMYQKIAETCLASLPRGIHGLPYREENYLSFRVFFGDMETDFYITTKATLVYWNKETRDLQSVSRSEIRKQYEAYLMAREVSE